MIEIKVKGGRLNSSTSLHVVDATESGPSKSIIAIPLILVTAFCFSYIQYNSAGDGSGDAGSHAVTHQSTTPLSGTTTLLTTQSELPSISAGVAAPDTSQRITSKSTSQTSDSINTKSPQPSARRGQSLQSSQDNSDNGEASNPQRSSSKSQTAKLDVELPHL
jgi:hypothetical protein